MYLQEIEDRGDMGNYTIVMQIQTKENDRVNQLDSLTNKLQGEKIRDKENKGGIYRPKQLKRHQSIASGDFIWILIRMYYKKKKI